MGGRAVDGRGRKAVAAEAARWWSVLAGETARARGNPRDARPVRPNNSEEIAAEPC